MRTMTLSAVLVLSLTVFGCAATEGSEEEAAEEGAPTATSAVAEAMTLSGVDRTMDSATLSRTTLPAKTSFGAKLADAGLVP